MNNHAPILFYPDTSDRVTKVENVRMRYELDEAYRENC